MSTVLLSADLLAASRAAGVAAGRGARFKSAATAEQAIEFCRAVSAQTLIIDLATPSLDIGAIVAALKADATQAPTIIAFGPHVQKERLAAARAAGCDHVLSRGQFMGQLEALL